MLQPPQKGHHYAAATSSGPLGLLGWLRNSSCPDCGFSGPSLELVLPSVNKLTDTNKLCILCTCSKNLPKAHIQHAPGEEPQPTGWYSDPTIRKDFKKEPKSYCCLTEGCLRGPVKPFSHFMKMHTEKNHKPCKCSNSYGTEWNLKMTCRGLWQGLPVCTWLCLWQQNCITAMIYQTSHDPCRNKDPPSKKRKGGSLQTQAALSNKDP